MYDYPYRRHYRHRYDRFHRIPYYYYDWCCDNGYYGYSRYPYYDRYYY
jgi:hypothetical protein